MCKLTVSKKIKSDINTLVNLTLEINHLSSLYSVGFEIYGIMNDILISIVPNEDFEEIKTFDHSLGEKNKNKYSLEFLTKLLEEVLRTNIKYIDLVNKSKYDIDAFLKDELENNQKVQVVCNDK